MPFIKLNCLHRVHYRFRRKYSILRIISIMLTKSEINTDKYYICKYHNNDYIPELRYLLRQSYPQIHITK